MSPHRTARSGEVRIGVSGWTYAPWRGRFYPKGLPHNRELAHASSVFPSIEINGTFYSMQRPDTFARWAEATPDDFVFAVKGPRFLTHMKRLNEPVAPLANFIASGPLRLGPKLGPILWQLPPSFRFDRAKLDAFFSLLPRDTGRTRADRCATPSRSVTKAFAIRPSSSSCASTISRWSAPTRSNGRS